MSIPQNYILGPGDEIIVSIWGQTQLRTSYTVSRDGKIYDEKVGLLNLSDKTISDGKKYLIKQFGRVYSTLTQAKPTSFIDVSLGEIKSINVNFVGQCSFPGVYPIHPFSNVITGLIQAGGIDTTGSLRNIKIIRDGKQFSEIDLYQYLLKGSLPSKIQLRDQDIVVVPARLSTVSIDSSIYRPGIYEAVSGETIMEIIEFAGGLKPNSSSQIGVERILPFEERKILKRNKEHFYVNFSTSNLIEVMNGDKLTANYLLDEQNEVEVIGQAKRPGKYHYYPKMSVKDLIQLSIGFNDTTFWKSIHSNSAQLIRRDPENTFQKVINVNLKEIIDGNKSANLKLQNHDKLIIRSNPNFFEKENVLILGEVNAPGSYSLISDKESLSSILKRAGGLTSKALQDGISIYRKKRILC